MKGLKKEMHARSCSAFSTGSSISERRVAPGFLCEDRHIGFILDIVRKKYCQEQIERHISHISHALLNNVDYHLTIDNELAEKFTERKVKLENLLGEGPIDLEVLLPSQLIKRLGNR